MFYLLPPPPTSRDLRVAWAYRCGQVCLWPFRVQKVVSAAQDQLSQPSLVVLWSEHWLIARHFSKAYFTGGVSTMGPPPSMGQISSSVPWK